MRGFFIFGLPGTPKLKVAQYISKWFGWKVVDIQKEVELLTNTPFIRLKVNDLESFSRSIRTFLENFKDYGVVLVSSDIPPDSSTVDVLLSKKIKPVYLSCTSEEALRRIEHEGGTYHILNLRSIEELRNIEESLLSRKEINIIPVEGFSDREISVMVSRLINPHFEMIFSNSESVYVGINALAKLDELFREAFVDEFLLITYKRLYMLHFKWALEIVRHRQLSYDVIFLPEKEEIKNLRWAKQIWDEFLRKHVSPMKIPVSMGGGSLGDLVGFASSTFMGGVPFVRIPTSLVSQVDEAIGGRNLMHLNGVRNVLGTTYHPKFVLMDPIFLLSLPYEEYLYSLVEIVKYAVLFDESLFKDLTENAESFRNSYLPALEFIIRKTALLKLEALEKQEDSWNKVKLLEVGRGIADILQEALNEKFVKVFPKAFFITLSMSKERGLLDGKLLERVVEVFNLYNIDYRISKLNHARLKEVLVRRGEVDVLLLDAFSKRPLKVKLSTDDFYKYLLKLTEVQP